MIKDSNTIRQRQLSVSALFICFLDHNFQRNVSCIFKISAALFVHNVSLKVYLLSFILTLPQNQNTIQKDILNIFIFDLFMPLKFKIAGYNFKHLHWYTQATLLLLSKRKKSVVNRKQIKTKPKAYLE